MRIIIDQDAGVCPGVARAITAIENNLQDHQSLISLGPVLHNYYEVERLKSIGLQSGKKVIIHNLTERDHNRYFIRTHGIAKSEQQQMDEMKLDYVDGTCTIVKRVQRLAERYYQAGYQIIVTGKREHPEIIGINSYCDNKALIIKKCQDADKVNVRQKTLLISQTTFSQKKFNEIAKILKERIPSLKIVDTTCKHINKRDQQLFEFAKSVEVVLMVGGAGSSNTGVLHDICLEANPNSYRIESAAEIQQSWLDGCSSVGITGSASTPLWQIEMVKDYLEKMSH